MQAGLAPSGQRTVPPGKAAGPGTRPRTRPGPDGCCLRSTGRVAATSGTRAVPSAAWSPASRSHGWASRLTRRTERLKQNRSTEPSLAHYGTQICRQDWRSFSFRPLAAQIGLSSIRTSSRLFGQRLDSIKGGAPPYRKACHASALRFLSRSRLKGRQNRCREVLAGVLARR